ncbi:MAG: tetratricopeptide repeat protein [Candidatus Azobacteroides pseudotrichonymphae]|nr:tetratricopeptide repeat protein [Bacteroidales bacterium OttesenSCG-928-I14]GMO36178.1 MAG: tetratricopeptide repeat protein [Candidatus Azobacteroides pseudotrichonymphae]
MRRKAVVSLYHIFYMLMPLLFCTCLFAGELPYENRFKFDYFFLNAICFKQKSEHNQAFNSFQYLLRIDSTSSVVLYELSKYYLFLNKEQLALNALRKATFYTPNNFEYKLALANLSRELGNNNLAIILYEELIKGNPQNLELYYCLSDLYVKQQNVNKAIRVLNKIENSIGINEDIALKKSQLYKLIGKKKQALRALKYLAEKFPTEAKYQIFIGDFYLDENEIEEALLYYERSKIMDPNNLYYFVAMSNYYATKGKVGSAIHKIERALEAPTLDLGTKLNILGKYIENLCENKQDKEAANVLFETLMEQYPQDKELNRMYGNFLFLQGKKKEAKFQFQAVIEAMPEDFEAWIQLLNIALQEENSDEIISICENALIHFPDVPEFYLYEGIAYSIKKAYQNALDIYLEGLKIISTDDILLSTFLGQIGDLYYQLGNKEKSFVFYEQAIKYNDKNIVVLNNYAYRLSLTKENLDKAKEMAAVVVQLQPDNITYIDTYAWIFFQAGDYSLAKFYIKNAISKDTVVNGEILEHYGDILYKTGDIDEAVSKWQEALCLKEASNGDTSILKKKITDKTYYYEGTK